MGYRAAPDRYKPCSAEGIEAPAESQQLKHGGVLHASERESSGALDVADNKHLLAFRHANFGACLQWNVQFRVEPVEEFPYRQPTRAAVCLLDDNFRASLGQQTSCLAQSAQDTQVPNS